MEREREREREAWCLRGIINAKAIAGWLKGFTPFARVFARKWT